MEQETKRKRRFGDRYDGYKVNEKDPLFHIMPFIMRSRLDSQVFFDEKIDITGLSSFITSHREDMPDLSVYHIFAAAVIRTLVQKPKLNRFVSGNRIYSRSYLRVSMTIKKSLDERSEEALVMPEFEPYDTLKEIVEKFSKEVNDAKVQDDGDSNATEAVVKTINLLPVFVKKFVIWTLRKLDNMGKMPKALNKVSPFHSSLYITNVGSIGLNSVYHHLYEFGTTSIFLSLGKRETVREIQSDGSVKTKIMINVRLTLDERICDGYYFSRAFKLFKQLVKNPHLLLEKPDYIGKDY